MKTLNNLTLLRYVKDKDYDSLIEQERLRKEGYSLHYIIDPALIQNYCFPKQFSEEEIGPERKARLSEEYLADEQVTLHSIFYLNRELYNVVLLDEYYDEYEAMLQLAIKLKPNKEAESGISLPSRIYKEISPEFQTMVYDTFSKLYATVLLHINGLSKASNLLTDKALILESKDLNNDFVSHVIDVNVGTITQTDKIKSYLQEILAESQNLETVELFRSKKRDALICDRLISFNASVTQSKNKNDKKNIFILLSDSTLAKNLFSRLKLGYYDLDYPKHSGKSVSLIRDIPQTFAHLISLAYTPTGELDPDQIIENLENLKRASAQVNSEFRRYESLLSITTEELLGYKIFENYYNIRNAFENTGILKSFDKIYESIKKDLGNKKLTEIAGIFKLLKENMHSLEKQIKEKHISYLQTLKNEAVFNTRFIYGVNQIKNNENSFSINKGADYIEGSYQLLPVFITFPSDKPDIALHLDKLILFLLERKAGDSQKMLKELENILNLMRTSRTSELEMIEINLLKTILFMLLPGRNVEQDKVSLNENDLLACNWVERIADENLIEDHLLKDKYYLLSWAYRRIRKYPEAIKAADKGIVLDKTDPRFYHGKLLAQYCMLQDKSKPEMTLINDIIKNTELSFDLYPNFLVENFNKFLSYDLISQKVTDSYNNSACYFKTFKVHLLFQNTKQNHQQIADLLKEARVNLNCLKVNKVFREALPEYYDTEAFLEYYESFYEETDSKRLKKIDFAKQAILKAIEIAFNNELIEKYANLLSLIEERMNDLKKN